MPCVSLRPLLLKDTPRLARYAGDPLVSRYLRSQLPQPYELAHAVSFYETCELNEQDGISLTRAILADGTFCGCISAMFAFDARACSAELGYWIGRPYWGQGIAGQAIEQMADLVFGQFAQVHRLYCSIFAENIASIRAVQKAGFALRATFPCALVREGRLSDECVCDLTRDQWHAAGQNDCNGRGKVL